MDLNRKKGQFTFRLSAALFILSAVFELLSLTAAVPLFGEIRGGISAVIYHAVYAALFLALGVGLWAATPWGYPLVFGACVFYSLDKLQFLLSQQAVAVFVKTQMAGFESELQSQGVSEELILQAIVLMSVVVVVCWWGFALYTYWRRDYFGQNRTES